MSKSKKSSKSAKIPQPIKIKKEKNEEDRTIHSMAHYVDDRLELVKQIFGSLKKKTITNLAPEYLKEMEMEEVQELCLNELLCLSKKRLLSIINATKCPTDTESSDDSDVQAKEEHVSLEEISSDSEIENGAKSSKKSGGGSQSRIKKISKKTNQSDGKTEPEGQISVLELLELQARARAIRSQLALEPVTKIEVDSDTEAEGNSNDKTTKTPPPTTTATSTKEKNNTEKTKKSHKKQSESKKATASTKEKNSNKTIDLEKPTQSAITISNGNVEQQISKQKIKIKRNFHNKNQSDETKTTESNKSENELTKPVEKSAIKEVKKEKRSRSPSPDVIPIVAEPETLCISDSNSEDENTSVTKSQKSISPKTLHNEETEDGEIVEHENVTKTDEDKDIGEITENSNEIHDSEDETKEKTIDDKKNESSVMLKSPANDLCNQNQNLTDEGADNLTTDNKSPLMHDAVHDHDEHSDDVISIEGGDLENEMSEHLDDEVNSNQSVKHETKKEISQNKAETSKNNIEIDIVSLDSSENEEESANDRDEESWNTRYMSSSKVKKVLAVSRLGKRVRDKLKTSKRSKNDSNSDKAAVDEAKISKYTSKHEDGSVDQYKELIKMSQRKS